MDDDVRWFQNVDEKQLYNYVSLCDLFLNTATTRYMLLTVMEAMACRLPVVTTTPLDGIVVNGVNGYLTETNDPTVIADIITNMLKRDDMVKMGVLEPLSVLTQAVQSATEVSSMILKIDDVIAASGLSKGPEE